MLEGIILQEGNGSGSLRLNWLYRDNSWTGFCFALHEPNSIVKNHKARSIGHAVYMVLRVGRVLCSFSSANVTDDHSSDLEMQLLYSYGMGGTVTGWLN